MKTNENKGQKNLTKNQSTNHVMKKVLALSVALLTLSSDIIIELLNLSFFIFSQLFQKTKSVYLHLLSLFLFQDPFYQCLIKFLAY